MSDPFSAASGAVGIISLGIQVSQGLVKYCSQVKNFTSEIATFKAKAESLDGILQNLESVLKKTEREQKMIPKTVVITLNGCAEALRKLNEGVGRYGKDRLSNRLTYCFVRDDLAAACNLLDSLQHNLSNALQVWMFEDSTRHQADITQMIADQSVTHLHTSRKFEGCFEDLSKKIDIIISSKQQPLLQTPSLLAQRCSELNAAKAEFSLLLLKYKYNVRLRLPHLCPCQCPASQYADGPRHSTSVYSVLLNSNSSSRHTCTTCKGLQIIRKKYNVCSKLLGYSIAYTMFLARGAGGFSIGPLLGFSGTAPTSSPAFRLLYATKCIHNNRHPFQRALDGKSWVYSGNDALRMHPEFDSSGGLNWDSSSHVVKYDEPEKALEQLEQLVNHTLSELHILFQNGKASPNDLDESGKSLSDAVCRWLIFAFDDELVKLSKTRSYSRNQRLAKCQQAIRILRTFVEHASSIGLNTSNILEFLMETHFFLPKDVDEGEFTRLQERICDLGAIIKHRPQYTWKTEFLRIFIRETQRIDVIDMPIILEAIFLQSEKGLEHILSRDPSAVNEVLYESGETPLHLAHQWPQGLRILIRAGGNVNQCNDCGELPLTLAANRNCYLSIKILLENGSMLRTDSLRSLRDVRDDGGSDFLRCIRNWRDSWRLTIFEHLIQRRQALLELARSLMIASPTSMSGWLKTDRVLDAQAADVVKELKSHGVYIDPKLLPASYPKTTTVYHMENLTPELAEAFYEAGFLDIDARDHEGRLPILEQTNSATYEAFDLPRWLITKGVDLTVTLDKENMITTLHDVCSSIGNNHRRWIIDTYEEMKEPPEDIDLSDVEFSQNVPLDLLEVDVIDSCICACSTSGCLPITCFLGNLQVEFRTGNPDHLCGKWEVLGDDPWITWRGELMVRIFAKILESKFSTSPWLVHNIIRQCTFYKLGLTHTCKCSQRICPPASSFTKDEVYNIMEEEQDMIEQLESLTAEFEKNYANSGKPLHTFLKDNWKPRMEEIMSESTSDEDYMKEVRELGVIMQ